MIAWKQLIIDQKYTSEAIRFLRNKGMMNKRQSGLQSSGQQLGGRNRFNNRSQYRMMGAEEDLLDEEALALCMEEEDLKEEFFQANVDPDTAHAMQFVEEIGMESSFENEKPIRCQNISRAHHNRQPNSFSLTVQIQGQKLPNLIDTGAS